ncbi:MAG: hypothetical protein HQL57_03265 [Magnetococcales bacterium]|nr:hypothetical protein [Magnetococcales bacterium]
MDGLFQPGKAKTSFAFPSKFKELHRPVEFDRPSLEGSARLSTVCYPHIKIPKVYDQLQITPVKSINPDMSRSDQKSLATGPSKSV